MSLAEDSIFDTETEVVRDISRRMAFEVALIEFLDRYQIGEKSSTPPNLMAKHVIRSIDALESAILDRAKHFSHSGNNDFMEVDG